MNGAQVPHLSGGTLMPSSSAKPYIWLTRLPGPSFFSGASTPSNMSTPSTANSGWADSAQPGGPSRKRSFGSSHLEPTLPGQPGIKSRRTTPSPAATAFTSPSPSTDSQFGDDVEIIDLTG